MALLSLRPFPFRFVMYLVGGEGGRAGLREVEWSVRRLLGSTLEVLLSGRAFDSLSYSVAWRREKGEGRLFSWRSG